MEYTIVIAALYFAPAIVAHVRGHRNKNAVTVLNTFLGWTFVGWIAALVWASTSDTEDQIKSDRRYASKIWGSEEKPTRASEQTPARTAPPQFENESDAEYLARLRRLGMIEKK